MNREQRFALRRLETLYSKAIEDVMDQRDRASKRLEVLKERYADAIDTIVLGSRAVYLEAIHQFKENISKIKMGE